MASLCLKDCLSIILNSFAQFNINREPIYLESRVQHIIYSFQLSTVVSPQFFSHLDSVWDFNSSYHCCKGQQQVDIEKYGSFFHFYKSLFKFYFKIDQKFYTFKIYSIGWGKLQQSHQFQRRKVQDLLLLSQIEKRQFFQSWQQIKTGRLFNFEILEIVLQIQYFSCFNKFLIMGGCLSKDKNSGVYRRGPQEALQDPQPSKSPEYVDLKISPRFEEYLKRKYASICGSVENPLDLEHMHHFFSFLGFEKNTLRNMHSFWRNNQRDLTFNNFKQGYFSLLKLKEHRTSKILYNLYFASLNHTQCLNQFKKQFQIFMNGVQTQVQDLQIRKSSNIDSLQKKFKNLGQILKSRKNIQENRETLKWLMTNIDFMKFKLFFMEGPIQIDQKAAFDLLIDDVLHHRSNQNRYAIVSLNWIKKFDLYARQKFQVQAQMISNLDSHNYSNSLLRKSSLSIPSDISGLSKLKLQNNLPANEIVKKNRFQIKNFDIINHPGKINNQNLAGNFQWQLKKNIRAGHDYIVLRLETYKKLKLCYGGAPFFGRNISPLTNYLEIKLYFVVCYDYQVDKGHKSYLTQKVILQFSPTQKLRNVLKQMQKDSLCFHRNIGGNWQKIPNAYEDISESEIHQIFTQTSFCFRMYKSSFQNFQQEYIFMERDPNKNPQIGDMYKKSLNHSNPGEPPIKVCISEETYDDQVTYVVLHHYGQQSFCRRRGKVSEFKKSFMLEKNPFQATLMFKKNRAGITNLGNTCYMASSLQALFSIPLIKKLFNSEKKYGKSLLQMLDIIQEKKKSCFPVQFKSLFDQDFPQFRGSDQQDAHQFLINLFQKLQSENESVFNQLFQTKIKNTNTCQNCQYKTVMEYRSPIITLSLLDFDKKEVKIDYITANTKIQTVVFEIPEECTIKEWYELFKKYSGSSDTFFCHIENSDVMKSYKIEEKMDEKYLSLQIESSHLIAAYEVKLHKTKQKLYKDHDFKVYINPRDKQYYISMINEEGSVASFYNHLENSRNKKPASKHKTEQYVAITYKKFDSTGYSATVPESQLLPYPEKAPQRQVYIKVINFDSRYNEKIGRPFIFKLMAVDPIAAVQEALQNTINSRSYFIRLALKDDLKTCFLCKRSCFSKKCFASKANQCPIEWYEGRAEYVVVWDNAQDYMKLIHRGKNIQKDEIDNKQFDSFNESRRRMEKKEKMISQKCDKCQKKNVQMEHFEKVSLWPRIVILHLKRFTVKRGELKKIHTRWRLEQEMMIDSVRYKLLGVVLHIGVNSTYGHYIAASDGFKFDDQVVGIMSSNDIPPQQIYMLVYGQQ